MKVFGLQGEILRAARLADKVLDDAQATFRLRQLERFELLRTKYGLTAAQAAEILGISKATLYRWQQRLDKEGVSGLIPRSRRPRRVRQRQWDMHLATVVRRLRMSFPAWGKAKLGPLVRAQGFDVSDSTVGRILSWLKARGRLPDIPPPGSRRRHGRPWRRPWARRAPYGLKGKHPGELIQVDVLHVNLLPGVTVYHFTAWDSVSRWSVGQVYSRSSSRCAADFLRHLQQRSPFEIQAIQIDGGSEFKGAFEQACQQAGIALYVLPPKRPQRNGGVERANGIWRYEFYACYPLPTTIRELRLLVLWWEQVYNLIRPHQALNQRTPAQYLRDVGYEVPEVSVSHMY